jgi:hypothetical protein
MAIDFDCSQEYSGMTTQTPCREETQLRNGLDVATSLRMLICGGFSLVQVFREPGYCALLVTRRDEFGCEQSIYLF